MLFSSHPFFMRTRISGFFTNYTLMLLAISSRHLTSVVNIHVLLWCSSCQSV